MMLLIEDLVRIYVSYINNWFVQYSVICCVVIVDPRGELCSYLEAVADARDVPSYVKDHPFGQLPITSAHPHWKFYSEVKQSLLKERAPKIV